MSAKALLAALRQDPGIRSRLPLNVTQLRLQPSDAPVVRVTESARLHTAHFYCYSLGKPISRCLRRGET